MKLLVITRVKSLDYDHLGREFPDQWWERDYKELYIAEDFSLLVRREHGKTRAYISGIPTDRIDDTDTTIRYTLVLEVESEDDGQELLRLAAYCINRFGESGSNAGLVAFGRFLDKIWATRVEEHFSKTNSFDGSWRELDPFIRTISRVGADGDDQQSWMGNIFEPSHRELFLARLHSILLLDVDGGAHYFPAVENWSHLSMLKDPLWILNPTSKDLIAREVPTEKKNVPATNSATPAPVSVNTKRILVAAGIAGLLLLMWMLSTDCQQ